MIPTIYAIIDRRIRKVRTKSKDKRFNGALLDLMQDVPRVEVEGAVAQVFGISPLRPARVVALEVIKGDLGPALGPTKGAA